MTVTPPLTAPLRPRLTRGLPWSTRDTLVFSILGALSAITRFAALSARTADGTPIFDEKHYVPQAYDQLVSARESLGLIAGGGIESNPGFGLVVHPPLGKRLIALGEAVWGYSPLGWRVVTAACGTLLVLAIMLLARRISRSTRVAAFAGFLALSDGVLLVISRYGMLDIFLVLFVVGAFYAYVRDREDLARYTSLAPVAPLRFGARPWLLACGLLLGLALSVKWSGLYYMAALGVVTVIWDAWDRSGIEGKRGILKAYVVDAPLAFVYLVIIPVLSYVFSWRAWFASETSSFRHAAEEGKIDAGAWYSALPDSVASWLYYHDKMLSFHSELTTSNGHNHPWESKPLSWLAALRPVLFYSDTDLVCSDGVEHCRRMVSLFGIPMLWWLTVPVLLWSIYSLIVRKRWEYLLVVVGYAAGYIPWLISYDRQMYFFYAVPLIPFIIIGLSLALEELWTKGRPLVPPHARLGRVGRALVLDRWRRGSVLVTIYFIAVAVSFVVYLPVLYGLLITDEYFFTVMWLRSWR